MKLAFAAMLICVATAAEAADTFAVPAEFWDRPRTGRAVSEQPAIRQAVLAYLGEPGSQLIVHHAYGQEAVLQAEEMRSWLMALAVDAARIRLSGDAAAGDAMKLEVVK
jgi:hypothetical protein